MDIDLLYLLSKGESASVELKQSTGLLRAAVETLCAFANHHGGHLVFGAEDNGRVVGQPISDDTFRIN